MNEKCKYYHDDYCSETCTDDWVKCIKCNEYLPLPDDEFEEVTGYMIFAATASCCDFELHDRIGMICIKCYEELVS